MGSIGRPLLVVHAVLGAATVATCTHLAVWSLFHLRGRPGRGRGIRWFSAVGLVLYVAQFALGNLLYPTYKVRVRVAYLDVAANHLGWVSALFERKEHVIALGLPLLVAAALLARRKDDTGKRTALALFLCAATVAACAWYGAIVGLIATSYRSIGVT